MGCGLGSGVSESSDRDRVLAERLLTIDWQQRELPAARDADAGTWLLITTSDADDPLAAAAGRRAESPRRGMRNRCTGRSTPTTWPAPNSLASRCEPTSTVWWSSPDRPAGDDG